MESMGNTIASVAIGVIVAGYMYALNAGWSLPIADNPRNAFIALVVIGMAFCSVGIGHSVETVGWSNPLTMLGVGFGLVNMYIVYIALTGGQFMFINSYSSASMALSGMMLVKVVTKIAMNFLYIR